MRTGGADPREAAAILGWPEGTVAGRLVRARKLLAKRLAPSVSITALLADTASARVPEVLSTAIPPVAAALTRELLRAMVRGKLVKTAVVVLLLGCTGFGVVAAQKPEPPAAAVEGGKAVNPAEADEVVWGEEVDGLQVGITRVARTYRHGEPMKPAVKLRNVGKTEVTISHGLLREYAPEVTAAGGVRMSVYMPLRPGIKVKLVERVIKPGETITLYNPEVAVESEDGASSGTSPRSPSRRR